MYIQDWGRGSKSIVCNDHVQEYEQNKDNDEPSGKHTTRLLMVKR